MQIRWTEAAVHDLTTICDYLAERDSPEIARAVALAIWDGIDTLEQFPSLGRPGRKFGTRELVLSKFPYLVIYRLHNDTVEINRVLHGAQRWP